MGRPIDATDPKSRKPSKLYVKLYGGGWRHHEPVSGLEQASEKMRTFLEVNGYGQNDVQDGCGDVVDMNGATIARVSPNGRVWDPRPYPQCECLYDPYTPDAHDRRAR